MSLLHIIHRLKEVNSLTKHEQLVQGIMEALDSGELSVGDKLPSINKMVGDIGYARKTIVKAYEELKERGLIESKKLKGYFIISDETNVTLRIALLLSSFQQIQEDFYNTFRNELGKRYQIDVFFHHNNVDIFETIFNNIRGKYGMYVVAPIPNKTISLLLETIAPEKLLIVDRYLAMPKEYSYISQELESTTLEKLTELLPEILKFKKIVLFYAENGDYPTEILTAFQKFLVTNELNGIVLEDYIEGSLEKEVVYFSLNDTSLWGVLKDCQNSGFEIGKEVGILSLNDHIIKKIAFGGITTISTDFKDMAKRAALHIKNNDTSQVIVTSKLLRRNSL